MPRTFPEDPAARQRRRRMKDQNTRIMKAILAGELKSYPECAYPTCHLPVVIDPADPEQAGECCYTHSTGGSPFGAFVPNDGIIDWRAIEISRKGERVVKLTWVEYEIAGAYILADGCSQDTMRERTGIVTRGGGSRMEKIKELADAFRAA